MRSIVPFPGGPASAPPAPPAAPRWRRAPLLTLAVALLLAALAWAGWAALAHGGAAADAASEDLARAALLRAEARELHAALQAELAAQRIGLDDLEAAYRLAPDREAALRIQREVRTAKIDGERRLLQLQLDHARRHDRQETVRRLERILGRMPAGSPSGMADQAVPVRASGWGKRP